MKEYKLIRDGKRLRNLSRIGFESGFDWEFELKTHQVMSIFIDKQLVGLISFSHLRVFTKVSLIEVAKLYRRQRYGAILLALVMREAIKIPDNGGYVSLRTKTNDVQMFYLHLGAIWFEQTMIFQSEVCQRNVTKYLEKGW
ncbi:GNAT family N-acetyltransferase [Furfurilactobacillus milii]|uniref:GNAT family N-acetyltransferase n=1 Tax=Furfurilactobacillus rossiae TaxID=231049 RepID=A0A7C9MS70_9LACO|nr:GNAT family N-acetyltransferase [Furfurilactobacillus milii]MYV04567.1 GNAT family N-acetyltransferase [Furfurilactobacillus milii]